MKKIIPIIVIAVLLVGAGVWYLRRNGQEGSAYQFVEVTRGDLENTVSSTGTLNPVGTVEIGTQVSGTIDRIEVDFNDKVREGQILASTRRSMPLVMAHPVS